ncbi:MAG: glycosyltransferase [Luteitalea sp.]|nr:glycosyltransferase [Luteitalea sp.]
MSIRVLQIGCVWPSERAGGGDRVFADLAKYLPSSGIALEAVVAGQTARGGALVAKLASFGAETDGTRARWLGARRVIAERLEAGAVDLVASHFALYASAALGRLRRPPHVVHFHGPWAAESREEGDSRLSALAKWAIERAVYRSARCVIVLSEAFAAVVTRDYGVPSERIRVIPGAADLERFMVSESRSEARRALGWPSEGRLLLSVRRLVHRTGVDRLIDAMRRVRAAVPTVRLFIAGTGSLRPALEARVSALGLNDAVQFLGYVPDEMLPLAYRAADLNVIPTTALEGFGLTAVEALAAGTPSLVTPIGGLPEIITPLCAELVCRSADVDDIARGLTDALSGQVAVPSAAACRSFAVERFSAELMARRVAGVYQELCA